MICLDKEMAEMLRNQDQHTKTLNDIIDVCVGIPFPRYTQPEEIGCFSLDEQRTFCDDSSQLRVFANPTLGKSCDLLEGYPQNYIERDPTKFERLDNLIRWIQTHQDTYSKFIRISAHEQCGTSGEHVAKRRRQGEGIDVQPVCLFGVFFFCVVRLMHT